MSQAVAEGERDGAYHLRFEVQPYTFLIQSQTLHMGVCFKSKITLTLPPGKSTHSVVSIGSLDSATLTSFPVDN